MASGSTASRRTSPRARPADPWWLRVRWDRIGRVSLLCVLVGIVLLYIGPAASWLRTWGEAKHQRHEVARLQKQHRELVARQKALKDPRTLEREARRLGMVRPDERSYVVVGLPR
jgi:cell division protein FtsB